MSTHEKEEPLWEEGELEKFKARIVTLMEQMETAKSVFIMIGIEDNEGNDEGLCVGRIPMVRMCEWLSSAAESDENFKNALVETARYYMALENKKS